MKICTKCNKEWPATPEYFCRDKSKKDGLHSHGKCCSIIYKRKIYRENREEINLNRRSAEYKASINKELRAIANKKYNSSEKGKAKISEYRKENKKRHNEDSRRYFTKIDNKIRKNIRSRLKKLLKNTDKTYNTSVSEFLNKYITYTPQELKKRMECQFKKGMSWKNYGVYGWHIDHKKPLILFDVSTEIGLKNACMLSNLQPLWAYENLSKSKKFPI